MVDNRCPMVIDFRAKLPVFLIASVGSPLAVFLSGRQPIEPSILSPLVRSCWELSCLVVLTTPFFCPSDHFITSCSACSWKPELDETGFSANVPIAF